MYAFFIKKNEKKKKTQNWVIKVSFRYYLKTNDKRIRVFYTFYMRDVSCSIPVSSTHSCSVTKIFIEIKNSRAKIIRRQRDY